MVKMPFWPIAIGYKDIDLGLSRMWQALENLGNPHLKLPKVIHFAGTNGKGSTLAFLRSILNTAGFTCHAYTSPHLVEFNERIVLRDKVITDEYLNDVLTRTKEACKDIKNLTFFEGTTLAAFLAFSEVPADFVLLETGLGGNLDATNVVASPKLSVITPIDFDHMEFLGNRIELIAFEKAKIMKPNCKAVIAKQPHKEASIVIEKYAEEVNCKLFIADEIRQFSQDEIGLKGKHQFINATTAIKCAELLGIDKQAILKGIKNANWSARLENIENKRINELLPSFNITLDGGHNPQAAKAIAEYVTQNDSTPNIAIIGMTKTKDAKNFANNVNSCFDKVYCIDIPEYADSAKAEDIYKFFENAEKMVSFEDCINDIRKNYKDGNIYICGSLYLAGWFIEKYTQIVS